MRALSIFLLNDSMWVWSGCKKKWKVMAFKKQLFPRKLWPSRRQVFVTPWVCGLLKRKKKCNSPREKWKSVVEREKEGLSKLDSKFLSETHMSTLALEQCFQKLNLSIGNLVYSYFTAYLPKKKKVIYGMFWLGSKLSKSFSFCFQLKLWNLPATLLAQSQFITKSTLCCVSLYSSQTPISDVGTNDRVLIVKPRNVKMRSFGKGQGEESMELLG